MNNIQVIAYARVSTEQQEIARQLDALATWAMKRYENNFVKLKDSGITDDEINKIMEGLLL
ncbi:recombinase family protein [Viridibacillus sp. NPDC093762]|uniref:recombinase family protein n=1 Tax=Viridibacillus sp. NPDC093762 TaxID=3390720 RepID=UPI003CFF231C